MKPFFVIEPKGTPLRGLTDAERNVYSLALGEQDEDATVERYCIQMNAAYSAGYEAGEKETISLIIGVALKLKGK